MTRYDMAATLSPPSSFNICINRKPSKDKLKDMSKYALHYTNTWLSK